jgi:hypothetical protein
MNCPVRNSDELFCSLMRVAVPGYVSFHAPMPAVSFFVKGTELSRKSLRLALFGPTLQSACPPLKVIQIYNNVFEYHPLRLTNSTLLLAMLAPQH